MNVINKKQSLLISLLLVPLLLLGCSTPLPPDKMDYAGEWQSKDMYILILQDGSIEYQRLQGGTTTEITGPIKEFNGDNFTVGFAFFTTIFEVSELPHEVNGTWEMVVDGVRLKRTTE